MGEQPLHAVPLFKVRRLGNCLLSASEQVLIKHLLGARHGAKPQGHKERPEADPALRELPV